MVLLRSGVLDESCIGTATLCLAELVSRPDEGIFGLCGSVPPCVECAGYGVTLRLRSSEDIASASPTKTCVQNLTKSNKQNH